MTAPVTLAPVALSKTLDEMNRCSSVDDMTLKSNHLTPGSLIVAGVITCSQ